MQLIETDGEIEGVVGIFRIDRVALKYAAWLGPARLLRILVDRAMKRGLRLVCDEAFQAALRSDRVQAGRGSEMRLATAWRPRVDLEHLR